MSDQLRKRWDNERRRQKALKPDYLEEIKLDNQKQHRAKFGCFEIDSEFRTKHPDEFSIARRNRDRVFADVKYPIIFLRERAGKPLFVYFSSFTFREFCEDYKLNAKDKSSKQLFKRLQGYAEKIKDSLKEEIRQWPMRAFVNARLSREFQFSNRLGMAAAVWISAFGS